MNKKYLIPLFAVLLIGGVFAVSYVVQNIIIQADVYEPFEVSYAILGDAGNWDGNTTCSDYDGEWMVLEEGYNLDVEGIYPSESRKFCVKINNLAEADIEYTLTSEVTNAGQEIKDKCVYAFGEHTLSGTATKQTQTINGLGFTIPADAEPVNDCLIDISVLRG